MARRGVPKTRSTGAARAASPAIEVDKHLAKARNELLSLFHTKGPKSEAYSLTTSIKAPLKYHDGQYKQALAAETDYLFSTAYFGRRGQAIFNFTPIDAQEFEHMELTVGPMATAFPAIISAFQEILIDADPELSTYTADEGLMLPADALSAMIDAFLEMRVTNLKEEEAHVTAKTKAVEENFYAGNPNWGLF